MRRRTLILFELTPALTRVNRGAQLVDREKQEKGPKMAGGTASFRIGVATEVIPKLSLPTCS